MKIEQKLKILTEKLKDERGRRVMFLSHCILNENTRYLGGAFRRGGIDEIVDKLQKEGIGIVQLPCLEQEYWGGISKKDIMRAYGSKGTLSYSLYKFFLNAWIWNTKRRYRKIAKKIRLSIEDYLKSGIKVLGFIGVDGSPTCGVNKTLSIKTCFDKVAKVDVNNITREESNKIILDSIINGEGYFIQALKKELKRKNIEIKYYGQNLLAEMKGEETKIEWNS